MCLVYWNEKQPFFSRMTIVNMLRVMEIIHSLLNYWWWLKLIPCPVKIPQLNVLSQTWHTYLDKQTCLISVYELSFYLIIYVLIYKMKEVNTLNWQCRICFAAVQIKEHLRTANTRSLCSEVAFIYLRTRQLPKDNICSFHFLLVIKMPSAIEG